jgi:flagellar motor switch/type III secretory pathway protein FliN
MSELDVDKMPVGDLPVILTFEIGQVETTLDELVSIGSGAVFKFEQARPGAVNIMAGARRLGVGEIFSLDGRTAVRIVSLD